MFVQEKNCINLVVLCFLMILSVEGVPPSMCFENFNHDDCGLDPTPVFYHYKPGSRCEVGFWRGCKPNLNMFRSLEDCVMTCIFAPKANAQQYHLIDKYYKRNMGFASEERHREKPWLNDENADTDEEHDPNDNESISNNNSDGKEEFKNEGTEMSKEDGAENGEGGGTVENKENGAEDGPEENKENGAEGGPVEKEENGAEGEPVEPMENGEEGNR